MSFKIIQLTAKCLVQAKHEVYLMSIQTCKPLSKLINKSSFIYWMNKLSHKTDNYVHCRYTQLFSQFFVDIPSSSPFPKTSLSSVGIYPIILLVLCRYTQLCSRRDEPSTIILSAKSLRIISG